MEYTVKNLAALAGVSARTLRYYDQIGLLCPARISSSGYRIYGPKEVDSLQQILLYRQMGLPLEEVAALLKAEGFDKLGALREHEKSLMANQAKLEKLLQNVRCSIVAEERGAFMTDKEKFEGFKNKLIQDNEKRYGFEIREKYGEDTVDASNAKMMGMTTEEYENMEKANKNVMRLLNEAFASGDVKSENARKLAEEHESWLSFTWPNYLAQAHCELVNMYVEDERFTKYYGGIEKTKFLRDCVRTWQKT